jgi:hypothetical protein
VNALHVEHQKNLGISGFLPIVRYFKKHIVSEAEYFPPEVRWWETPAMLVPSERVNLRAVP